ncbi:hypothetical protein QR680_001341 [Steinernema hermaphroditum]|uniref:ABC transporter domain-containing protein n=1 Tax=Steinernema hermaphroditum TaxID=289476 RepID=A0AA39GZF7_9BILA|nr:hypothetical protein QR680_001341 [Steinernema hermaphroditum]
MAVKPNKDDLHQWSIFRQNLNSSMASTLLNVPCDRENEVLPFGSFRMSEQAVKGVLEAGRCDERDMSTEPATYLRFGLPRVLVGNNVGDATLQRPSKQNRSLDRANRRTQSEWDLRPRKESSNAPSGDTPNCFSPISGGTHYAESDIATVFNRAGHQSPVIPLSMSRHHRPYFSNLELAQQFKGYNYLKYAKAEELRRCLKSSPHVQISNLGFNHDLRTNFDKAMLRDPKYLRTIDGVTLELYAGDTMTLMYTSELEMRTILGILSNQHRPSGKIDGMLEINGHRVTPEQFGERCAYVGIDEPYPWMTVQQYLSFACAFYKPATDAFEIDRMIDQLIHTLALTPFKSRLCRDIGRTERQRLKIAAAVIMDTDILICDNIVRDMDIYDVAFIVDYLRDWAIKLSRIVIIAMSPPTIEVLTMFQKCAILASGHFVYFGNTHQMVGYFESIGHPCPQFKNPCDYYALTATQRSSTMAAVTSCPLTEEIYGNVGINIIHGLVVLLNATGALATIIMIVSISLVKVLHVNFTTLLTNLGIQLLFRAACTTFRSTMFLYNAHTYTNACDLQETEHDCSIRAFFFASFQETIVFSFIAMGIERSWATLKYETYEHHARWMFRVFLVVFAWLRVELVTGQALVGSIAPNETKIDYCISIHSKGMSWSFLLYVIVPAAVVSALLFLFVYIESSKTNRRILHLRHSLSSRFQLGENIRTTHLIVPCAMVYVGIVVVQASAFLALHEYNFNLSAVNFVLVKELLSLLAFPVYTNVLPIIVIFKHPDIRKKFKSWIFRSVEQQQVFSVDRHETAVEYHVRLHRFWIDPIHH